MTKYTPIPDFDILFRVLFPCLKCGTTVEMPQNGLHHAGSTRHCGDCGACYVAQWAMPLIHSTIKLLEDDESEASA